MCPKIVISEERKADFKVCPYTKRYINTKPMHKPLPKELVPGRVCIILSGPYAGKRAIYVKQLENGNLLFNGPFGINQVPLCAVPKHHVIITSTLIEGVKGESDVTFTMLCKPKGLNKKEQEEFAKTQPAYLAEAQKKADAEMVPCVKGDYVEYLKAPFVIRPQDKVHEFKF